MTNPLKAWSYDKVFVLYPDKTRDLSKWSPKAFEDMGAKKVINLQSEHLLLLGLKWKREAPSGIKMKTKTQLLESFPTIIDRLLNCSMLIVDRFQMNKTEYIFYGLMLWVVWREREKAGRLLRDVVGPTVTFPEQSRRSEIIVRSSGEIRMWVS